MKLAACKYCALHISCPDLKSKENGDFAGYSLTQLDTTTADLDA